MTTMQTSSHHSDGNPQRPIRVCFVILRAYPLFNPAIKAVFGGAEVDLYLLATELAKDSRFDVRFVVGDYGQQPVEHIQGVTLYKSLDVLSNYFLHIGKLWSALRQADADIYIQEACSLLTAALALFCRRHHRRFIYRTASRLEAGGQYFRQHRLRAPLIRWAFGTADPLIVQNQEDQRCFTGMGLESIIIRNACRLHDINPAGREFVLWVGRSDPVKRADLFIKMARSMPEVPFLMICSRHEGDSRFQDLTDLAQTVPNLRFIPGVPFEQVDAYFEKALLYVNTSDSEGFPNTFVQACKSQTPVLSLNVNPDDFLSRHQCGLYAQGNWNEFLMMARLLLKPDNLTKFGKNGRLYAEKNHDIKQIIECYKDLFLNRPGRSNDTSA